MVFFIKTDICISLLLKSVTFVTGQNFLPCGILRVFFLPLSLGHLYPLLCFLWRDVLFWDIFAQLELKMLINKGIVLMSMFEYFISLITITSLSFAQHVEFILRYSETGNVNWNTVNVKCVFLLSIWDPSVRTICSMTKCQQLILIKHLLYY